MCLRIPHSQEAPRDVIVLLRSILHPAAREVEPRTPPEERLRQAKPAVDRLESRQLLTGTNTDLLTSAFGLKGGAITISAVATDSAGDVYVTGTFKGTVNFDPTGTTGTQFTETTANSTISEIFVAEYGTDGTPIVVVDMAVDTVNPNAQGEDSSTAIAVDSNGLIYVTGYFRRHRRFLGWAR